MNASPQSTSAPAEGELHTETPWKVFKTTDGRRLVGIGGQDGEGILDCGFGVWAWDDASGIANADLVVEAVNSHKALKARVADLEARLEIIGNGGNVVSPNWRTTGPKTREQMAEIARAALQQPSAADARARREEIAKTVQQFWQGPSGRPWDGTDDSCCVKLPPQADWFRRLADALISKGVA